MFQTTNQLGLHRPTFVFDVGWSNSTRRCRSIKRIQAELLLEPAFSALLLPKYLVNDPLASTGCFNSEILIRISGETPKHQRLFRVFFQTSRNLPTDGAQKYEKMILRDSTTSIIGWRLLQQHRGLLHLWKRHDNRPWALRATLLQRPCYWNLVHSCSRSKSSLYIANLYSYLWCMYLFWCFRSCAWQQKHQSQVAPQAIPCSTDIARAPPHRTHALPDAPKPDSLDRYLNGKLVNGHVRATVQGIYPQFLWPKIWYERYLLIWVDPSNLDS